MNHQELQPLRAMIVAHKRWDYLFGVLEFFLALMLGVMTFAAFRRHGDQRHPAHQRRVYDVVSVAPGRPTPVSSAWVGSVLVMLVTAVAAVPLASPPASISKNTHRRTGLPTSSRSTFPISPAFRRSFTVC